MSNRKRKRENRRTAAKKRLRATVDQDPAPKLPSTGQDLPEQHRGTNQSIVVLLLEAMKNAPPGLKAVLGLFGAVTILSGGAGAALGAAGESTLAFLTVVLAVVCFIASIIVLLRLEQPVSFQDESGREAQAGQPLQSLVVVKVPLPASKPVREIREKIEALRHSACAWLREEHDVNVEASDIRAHIFLPDYHSVSTTGVLPLFMPEIWQVNMEGHTDEHLRLRPGQGVAGLTYESEQPQQFVIANGEWPPDVLFDSQQRALRHREIRWIVGIPLTVPEGPTLGVLGIHGLRVAISSKQASQLSGKLHYLAAVITARLNLLEQGIFQVSFRRA